MKPIVTETTAAGPFYRAEGYHQPYVEKQGRAAVRSHADDTARGATRARK